MASAWSTAFGSSFGNSWGSISSGGGGGGGSTPPDPVDPMDPDSGITNPEATAPPPPNYLICDRTGFRVSVGEGLRKEWDGTMVRAQSYTKRHPMDLMRAKPEGPKQGSPRPETTDVDIDELYPDGVSLDDLDP